MNTGQAMTRPAGQAMGVPPFQVRHTTTRLGWVFDAVTYDGTVIGQLVVGRHGRVVIGVDVDPAVRRHGVATALWAAAVATLPEVRHAPVQAQTPAGRAWVASLTRGVPA